MLTAITGGIGSGKSTVSRVLRAMGYHVYDCDSRAKRLMDSEPEIKRRLVAEIHPECLDAGGRINRSRLSEIVFSDNSALDRLNGIVHEVVRRDLKIWCQAHACESRLFVETAILYQSGIDAMVNEVWDVTAPLELKIERVMARNSLTREQVVARISSQDSFIPVSIHPNIRRLMNDGDMPILPQIEQLI